MELNEYQRTALRTANPALDGPARQMDAAAGLAEEAGEVLGLVRKRVYQQREATRDQLVEELGDVLWCLAVTAESLGVTLEEVGATNVAKLRRRHPDGFRAPSA